MTSIKTFLQENTPLYVSRMSGFAGTVLLWLLLLLCLWIIKPRAPKSKFKEVQIVLSSPGAPAKTSASPASEELVTEESAAQLPAEPVPEAAAEETSASAMPQNPPPAPPVRPEQVQPESPAPRAAPPKNEPVVREPPAPKKPAAPSPAPASPATREPVTAQQPVPAPQQQPAPAEAAPEPPSVPVPEPVYESVEDALVSQLNAPKRSSTAFDWSQFDDDIPDLPETPTSPQSVVAQNSLSGTAGAAAALSGSERVSSSETQAKTTVSESTGQATKALANIANATYSSSTADVTSRLSARTGKNGDGKNVMEMSDGTSRALLSDLRITLSEEAAALVENDRNVTITFLVTASGNVPLSEIRITPESVLPEKVRQEISAQIARWRFEPADASATARFEYSLIKR